MNHKFTAIIQARTGSSRYRNKVLKTIMKKPILFHIIRRLQQSKFISSVVVATTDRNEDMILKQICDISKINIFFGSTNDVLDRYFHAAKTFNSQYIVRITADSPVIDHRIVDEALNKFQKDDVDYLSNWLVKSFPEGISVEVFSFEVLKKAWEESRWTSEREHVTPYIWKNPERFKLGVLTNHRGDQSEIRLTLDYPRDLLLIRKIYENLFPSNPYFGLDDILDLLEKNPFLRKINNDIPKYEGYAKSLELDILLSEKEKKN